MEEADFELDLLHDLTDNAEMSEDELEKELKELEEENKVRDEKEVTKSRKSEERTPPVEYEKSSRDVIGSKRKSNDKTYHRKNKISLKTFYDDLGEKDRRDLDRDRYSDKRKESSSSSRRLACREKSKNSHSHHTHTRTYNHSHDQVPRASDEKPPVKRDRDEGKIVDYKKLNETLLISKDCDSTLLASEIAQRLQEPKTALFGHVARVLGQQMVLEIFSETKEIVNNGGLKTDIGDRVRTPGGTFLYVMKSRGYATPLQCKEIFKEETEEKKLQKKKAKLENFVHQGVNKPKINQEIISSKH